MEGEDMFCAKCGAQVTGKFCTNCGAVASVETLPRSEMETREFRLIKAKMLGTVTYKTTETTVTVSDEMVDIRMSVQKIFRKPQMTEQQIPMKKIQKVSVRTVWDFWDTLYALIFIALGFSAPVLFLGAIVCLWCGYGREVEIILDEGEKCRIPASSDSETSALVGRLNKL